MLRNMVFGLVCSVFGHRYTPFEPGRVPLCRVCGGVMPLCDYVGRAVVWELQNPSVKGKTIH